MAALNTNGLYQTLYDGYSHTQNVVWTLLLFLLTITPSTGQGQFERDVALNKPITANVTCGYRGSELFYNHDQVYTSGPGRLLNEKRCLDVTQFPASALNDGNPLTFWQTTSRQNFVNLGFGSSESVPDAIITLVLQNVSSWSMDSFLKQG